MILALARHGYDRVIIDTVHVKSEEQNQMATRAVLLSWFPTESPPEGIVDVQTGAWNVGSTSGYDFSQWAGADSRRNKC